MVCFVVRSSEGCLLGCVGGREFLEVSRVGGKCL